MIHLHSAKAGLVGRLAVRGRIPTLFQPHGWSWLASEGVAAHAAVTWERAAAHWANVVVCVGSGEAELARRQRLAARLAVVRNGVDGSWFRAVDDQTRARARSVLGVRTGIPVAVCVGRVTRQKGQDLLLDAWPEVIASRPDAQLVVVGDGDLRPALQRRAPPGVRFTGNVPDARPWYAAADLVVFPSRWEGLSLALLEALASGRSVVASEVSGHEEVVTEGIGVLVPAANPASLAAAITRRLDNRELARAEGTAAAPFARRKFDVRHTWDLLAAVTAEAAGYPVNTAARRFLRCAYLASPRCVKTWPCGHVNVAQDRITQGVGQLL